ncbi:hypothetical protein PC41400_05060 [Paenibacillus chitinolyticus]|uniref:Glycosyltransferase n=1 Tax=Paenibacillus chitinolyticus TaxID=79263 RepID=A0A410WRV3_9BACL|nr:glycosyltransferase [Paenibacillus chitinolyticus]MCY9592021.1 glycosyltransferase [Paenibacillus chitinolyticus]MCY9598882.1 glycosyltransferase [Paenibacillus chitinolyticus]QAV17083.1 hypothetical protein PC41400_05060 [Paenibacillus chitinolyticus]
MIVTTSICANYLPKAMVLAKSVKEADPSIKVVVSLLEREVTPEAQAFEYFDDIVLGKDLGFENFEKFIFKHSIVEASTAVKGQLFLYLMENYQEETKFVYLDPDIQVLSSLTELEEALESNPIVLTPHLTTPEDIMDAVMDNELSALKHGAFNLGFLAVSRSEESKRFIEWWASRLDMFCYDDIPRGIFTDQKWMDLAPCFFDVYILKHPGYNAAPWNVSKRKIHINSNNEYIVNDKFLRFFHFSGFDSGANEGMINKYVPDKKNAIYKLRDEYVKEMNLMGQEELGAIPWSYDYFNSGEKIERTTRIAYRDNLEMPYKFQDPFNNSNAELNATSEQIEKKENFVKGIKKVVKKFIN